VCLGLPEETVACTYIGTVRKDAAVALLDPIGLNNDADGLLPVVSLKLYFSLLWLHLLCYLKSLG